jgi:hypothetical protein
MSVRQCLPIVGCLRCLLAAARLEARYRMSVDRGEPAGNIFVDKEARAEFKSRKTVEPC